MGWDKKPSDFSKKMVSNLEKATKKVVVQLVADLTFKTPVDTGRARSNWIVTAGTPTDDVQTIEDKSGTPSRESADALKPKLGEVVYISNNLPYIGYLENGTPTSAPYAMVRRSIESTARKLGR